MSEDAAKQNKHPGGLGMALDFGPLLVFFLTYKFTGVIAGTIAFMAAIAIAVIISKLKLGKVSPMLWLSAILVIGFGALTVYFNDPRFIQIKPTIIYLLFSISLFVGLAMKKPLLKFLLQAAYDGLDEAGWMKLSRNWAIFFAGMALLNEAMRALLDFDLWLTLKVWGVTILSMVFALANIPMMMRHGLSMEPKDVVEEKPAEG
ncbi:septation protein IspZ [Sphingomonas colocasiae]|uniref:Inner membrane-spanning protein YciB n=1 Tax=Sphingomonas colocasiae TaxID=1848973 RepID=A0ABS7PNU2_9SPHN|nr:septation protein IspZ [Sphingomonas colocasiae]MBY8822903.1 septation protein IspZ [Sphingomonas colocasiae]